MIRSLCCVALIVLTAPALAGPAENDAVFKQGLAFLEQGQPQLAVPILLKLYDETKAPRVKLELARAYLLNGDVSEARRIFIEAYEQNPPPSVRAMISNFLDQIEKTEGKVSLGVSATKAQNPLKMPAATNFSIGGWDLVAQQDPKKKNLFGMIYTAGYERNFSDGIDLRVSTSVRSMFHSTAADFGYLDASIGKQLFSFPAEFRLGEQSFVMQGQNYNMPYFEVANKTQLSSLVSTNPRLQIGYFKSKDYQGLSGGSYKASIPIELTFAPHQVFGFGIRGERRSVPFSEQSYWSGGPFADANIGFDAFSINATASIKKTRYDATDPFWGEVRSDWSYYQALNINFDAFSFKGLKPSAGVYCDITKSNISYFKTQDCGFLANLKRAY